MGSKEFWENNIYSRGELDKLIYENFINQKLNDGIVLEIGGHDGGWLSVSNFFEKQLGFKAILVEPIKDLYETSKQKRPNATHFNYAVNKEKGKLNILKPSDDNIQEISSLEASCISEWKHAWGLSKTEVVECVHMSDITSESNLKYIDLLIIDVEGHELDVLETFDWDNVEVGVISIELLSNLENYTYFREKDVSCREHLCKKGFIHKKTLCGDEFWVNPNYFRIQLLFGPIL
jgi:FkbM family methyltransferase